MLRKCPRFAILLVGLLLVGLPDAGFATDRPPMIVSTAWLAEHLTDPNLVIIHVGAAQDYRDGHIPGAQLLELSELSTPHEAGFMMQLPPVAQLKATFEKVGVSNDSRIVLYFSRNWVTAPSRVYWTLDYLGLGDRASYLDGGLNAWRAEDRAVTTEALPAGSGTITPAIRENVLAEANWVNASLQTAGVAILDARTPQFYEGKELGTHAGRLGHIAGAKNLPFTALMNEKTLKFKSVSDLQELFRAVGVKPGDTVVTYCHIGMQASLLYFVARSLGYDARMFDGSFQEWSNRKDLPVEGPAEKPSSP
ncbi:MAG: sulfurtransferase [Acidobacteria bacterium]|nr:sulfurtransferase [Acidobacteriota bacterium]